ncbi:MAG: 2,3-bisphosphoglycerate-independent phosphoglycerate mutase [Candidatus Woesebacteria bacterium GW2011_GWE1_45_18]|uniref:2,3-bisphosphoglycerate-independent phosphoglycerate mutase n=1 Tax=Candidatus Woesebacteria bacterium GW2011_GWE1_45_18 TaxID=1618598 RepID=A0A0G1M2A2_9BACT|nr:MAG: 2,3-bisphosphoglycerate-independent phosphoglycerate mutase [Candidatus Woesebacteria bacterium GW2011_GWE1_45_18]
MSPVNPTKFVCLVVLDGWGMAAPGAGNAISQASTVNMNRFWASFPHTQLAASGEAVGLPRGEAGNTETGHLNLGAGRIVYQDLARINMSVADGSFFKNPALLAAIEHAKKNNSNLHYLGLIGAAGVHSNLEHLYALIQLAARQSFKNVFLHLFTDGRDSPPTSAKTYINSVREVIAREGVGTIASIMGRYWAMDRDLRWDRTAKAYFALTKGQGHLVKTPEEAIEMSYSQGKTDEFIEPAIITQADGAPVTLIKDNDAAIFFNFRIDRPRQLSRAFVFQDFTKANLDFGYDPYLVKYAKKHEIELHPVQEPFNRGPLIQNLFFVTMTEYGKTLDGAKVAFPPETVDMPLGRVIAEAQKKQLRVAESEKERFVTFYFNGQQETAFEGDTPSPKVATYDLKPEMSAREMTDSLLAKLREENQQYSFILVNFANPDMVGHTGSIGPAVKACEVVDECVGKIANTVLAYGGSLLITADHGNVEQMINTQSGAIETEHSTNPVPLIVVSKEYLGNPSNLPAGILADIAPTVLALLGLTQPTSMTGRNLLESL